MTRFASNKARSAALAQPPASPRRQPSPDPFAVEDMGDFAYLPPSVYEAEVVPAQQRAKSACYTPFADGPKRCDCDVGQYRADSATAPLAPVSDERHAPLEGQPATTVPRAPRLGPRSHPVGLHLLPALSLPDTAALEQHAPDLACVRGKLAAPVPCAPRLGPRAPPLDADSIPVLLLPEPVALAPTLVALDFDCVQKPQALGLDACRRSPGSRHRVTSCSTTATCDGEWDKESAVSFVLDGLSDAGGASDEDR